MAKSTTLNSVTAATEHQIEGTAPAGKAIPRTVVHHKLDTLQEINLMFQHAQKKASAMRSPDRSHEALLDIYRSGL